MALDSARMEEYRVYLDQDRCGIQEFRGRPLVVLPSVFDPTHNTPMLAELVERRAAELVAAGHECHILEMGTGCGAAVLSVATQSGVRASACDISPMCVLNTQVNALWWGVDCHVYQSDLFAEVPPGRFDIVFWSPPWISGDPGGVDGVRYLSAFDPDYTTLGRFLEDCRGRLTRDGRVYLGVDRDVCDYPLIVKMLDAAGYQWTVAAEQTAAFEGNELTYVYLELRLGDSLE